MTRHAWTKGFQSQFQTITPIQKRALNSREEEEQQVLVIKWAGLKRYKGQPLSEFIHHSPNGGKREVKTDSRGNKYCPEGAKLKAMGTRPGFPDLTLYIARGAFHGLYIEMKAKGGSLTREQKDYQALLRGEGYKVVVCYSASEAIQVIEDYLALPACVIAGIEG